MLVDIAQSLAWSLVGFIIGWLLGREAVVVHQIREAVVTDGDTTNTPADPPRQGPPVSRMLGIVVIVLALASVGQAAYFTYEQRQRSQCQADLNERFRVALTERGRWADEDRAALIGFFRVIYTQPGNDDAELEAFQTLITTADRNDRLRATNPLPDLGGDC